MTPFFYKLTYVHYYGIDEGEKDRAVGGVIYAESYVNAMQQLQNCFGSDLVRIDYLENGMESDIVILPAELADSVRDAYFAEL